MRQEFEQTRLFPLERNEFKDIGLDAQLSQIGFEKVICTSCNSEYFKNSVSQKQICGFEDDVSIPKGDNEPGHFIDPPIILETLFNFVEDQDNLLMVKPRKIINSGRQPLFVVAGVQIIDPILHDNIEIPSKTLVVAQPSVRLNFLGKTKIDDGTYTSFVNVAMIQVGKDLSSHVANIQKLLNFFGNFSLDVTSITMRLREKENNWGEGNFNSLILDLGYKGISLGDAVFIPNFPQDKRERLTISDISFGLERLMLATNGETPERKISTDLPEANKELFDLVKTVTLLIGSSVFPSSTYNPGRKTRELIKRLDSHNYGKNSVLFNLINYYWNWWKQFAELEVDPDDIYSIIVEELESIGANNDKKKKINPRNRMKEIAMRKK